MPQDLVRHPSVDTFGIASLHGNSLHPQDFKPSSIINAASLTKHRLNQPFAVWREEYYTGNWEIDREHQELFDLVNSLHDGMLRGEDQITLRLIFEDLATHTLAHFYQEETLMQSCDYPRYERHKQSHDGLKTKVVDLLEKFNLDQALLTVAVTRFSTNWLVHHIRGEDRKLTEFLHAQIDRECEKEEDKNKNEQVTDRVTCSFLSSIKLGIELF
jgi:hemerythrin